ncbi:MAG: hypothetical protein H7222_09405 [Methylotenera sp.]|nr:hypothetical protein [Oligoflexia bacterium]
MKAEGGQSELKLFLKQLHFDYEFPAKSEPSWKSHVDRWYQLDAPAYGLVQAYSIWKDQLPILPAMILLASPGASNKTDRQFAKSGGISPAKFAHTLPNIRCSPLCQVMDWSGPVLSFHRDPHTLVLALREAFELLSPELPSIWVLAGGRKGAEYRVDGFVISQDSSNSAAYSISKRAPFSALS